MYFVQDHEAVIAGKSGMNRAHLWGYSVAAEQQTRAELIHGGNHDPRLIWTMSPLVVNGNTTSQHGDPQRLTSAQCAQAFSNPPQYLGLARFNPVPD